MATRLLLIILSFNLLSCSDKVDIGNPISFGETLVYFNGQLGNYINSSYSRHSPIDGSPIFFLQFAESKKNSTLVTSIVCKMNQIPISNSYYFPIGYKSLNNQEAINIRLAQTIQWDLSGPKKYIYDYGPNDYIHFENVDTIDHVMTVRGKLTFKTSSAYLSQPPDDWPVIVDFAIQDNYTAY